jgi:hypothetical protein
MRHVEDILEHCLPETNKMHEQLSQLVAMADQDEQDVHPVLAADVAALRTMGLNTMQDVCLLCTTGGHAQRPYLAHPGDT